MNFVDQLHRKIELDNTPKRIVSLVPSQTELLVALGLEDHIVGVTKFCVHPNYIRKEKRVVGGTKKIKYEVIEELQPDIILCNKEENTKEIVEHLEKKYPVHVSDIFELPDALEMIKQYGEIFDKGPQAKTLISKIRQEEQSFKEFIANKPKKHIAYFIWKDPWMAVGNTTFVHHILQKNGFINVFGGISRYPEVTPSTMLKLEKLDIILLSSEPFPFSEKHIEEARKLHPTAAIKLVDGEYFSWYGSRLTEAFTYFKTLH